MGYRFRLIDFVYKGQRYKRSSGTTIKAEAQALEAEWRKELKEQALFGKAPDMTLAGATKRYVLTVIRPKAIKHHLDVVVCGMP